MNDFTYLHAMGCSCVTCLGWREKLDAANLQIREEKERTNQNFRTCVKVEEERDAALRLIDEVRSIARRWQNSEASDAGAIAEVCSVVKPEVNRNREGDGHICIAAEDVPCSLCGRFAEKRKCPTCGGVNPNLCSACMGRGTE